MAFKFRHLLLLRSRVKAQVRVWKSNAFQYTIIKSFQGGFSWNKIDLFFTHFFTTYAWGFRIHSISFDRRSCCVAQKFHIVPLPYSKCSLCYSPKRFIRSENCSNIFISIRFTYSLLFIAEVWKEDQVKVTSLLERNESFSVWKPVSNCSIKIQGLLHSQSQRWLNFEMFSIFPYRLSRLWIGFIFGSHFHFFFIRQFSFHFSSRCSFHPLLCVRTAHDHHVKFIIHEFGRKRKVCVLLVIVEVEKCKNLNLYFICCRLLLQNQWYKIGFRFSNEVTSSFFRDYSTKMVKRNRERGLITSRRQKREEFGWRVASRWRKKWHYKTLSIFHGKPLRRS